MSFEPRTTAIAHAPLTDAERLEELMNVVVTLSALESQLAAVRERRLNAIGSRDIALSNALACKEDETTEAEVSAMYIVVAQAKILFGSGILERCRHQLISEVEG